MGEMRNDVDISRLGTVETRRDNLYRWRGGRGCDRGNFRGLEVVGRRVVLQGGKALPVCENCGAEPSEYEGGWGKNCSASTKPVSLWAKFKKFMTRRIF